MIFSLIGNRMVRFAGLSLLAKIVGWIAPITIDHMMQNCDSPGLADADEVYLHNQRLDLFPAQFGLATETWTNRSETRARHNQEVSCL